MRTIILTPVPRRLLALPEGLVCSGPRWQIARLFRLWKPYGQSDARRTKQPSRVLTERSARIYTMLIQPWLLHQGCWHDPRRSLFHAAQVLRRESNRLMVALSEGTVESPLTSILHLLRQTGGNAIVATLVLGPINSSSTSRQLLSGRTRQHACAVPECCPVLLPGGTRVALARRAGRHVSISTAGPPSLPRRVSLAPSPYSALLSLEKPGCREGYRPAELRRPGPARHRRAAAGQARHKGHRPADLSAR